MHSLSKIKQVHIWPILRNKRQSEKTSDVITRAYRFKKHDKDYQSRDAAIISRSIKDLDFDIYKLQLRLVLMEEFLGKIDHPEKKIK